MQILIFNLFVAYSITKKLYIWVWNEEIQEFEIKFINLPINKSHKGKCISFSETMRTILANKKNLASVYWVKPTWW